MTNQFQNVHTFDGTLGSTFSPSKNFSKEERVTLFNDFSSKLQDDRAKSMISVIIRDLDTEGNLDRSNNVDSSLILAEIAQKIKNTEDISLSFIEEQIGDMANLGPCPEGRTTRFLQIWNAIKDCN